MKAHSGKINFSGQVSFSNDSNYFGFSKGMDLIVYDCHSLKVIQKYNFCDYIEDIQWSPDNKLILVGLYKRGVCEIRGMNSLNWYCKIDEGILGMNYALFSPDSFHVLSFSENNIKLTIRSLTDKSTFFINFPKFSKKGLSFSKRGNFMALAERKNAKDLIGVYFLGNWTCINKFIPGTEDLRDIQWSYDSSSLLIQDSPTSNKLFIYSPFGDEINIINLNEFKLGIKDIEISSNGHYICLGLFDQTLRILNNISYTCVSIFEHNKKLLEDTNTFYFREELIDIKGKNKTKYVSLTPPINIEKDYKIFFPLSYEDEPKVGISKMSFSFDCNYLATKNENTPNIIYIWDLTKLKLHSVLIQINEVNCFQWVQNQFILFISTGNNKLYYYTLGSCEIVELEKDFSSNSFIISNDGKKMIIRGNNNFIIADIKENNLEEISKMDNDNINIIRKDNNSLEIIKNKNNQGFEKLDNQAKNEESNNLPKGKEYSEEKKEEKNSPNINNQEKEFDYNENEKIEEDEKEGMNFDEPEGEKILYEDNKWIQGFGKY